MTTIFISYRRSDAHEFARRIYDGLAHRLGSAAIVMDVDSFPFDMDYRAYLDHMLLHTDVMLVIIGPNWIGAGETESGGSTESHYPSDLVRWEIGTALALGKPVIPVLVAGAQFPPDDQLPPLLQTLRNFQWYVLRDGPSFAGDLDHLIDTVAALVVQLPPLPPPPPPAAAHIEIPGSQINTLVVAIFVGALLVTVVVGTLLPRLSSLLASSPRPTVNPAGTQSVVTATAIAAQTQTVTEFVMQPYATLKPGPACDPNPGAVWLVQADQGQEQCLTDSLQLTGPAVVTFTGINGVTGQFPSHYIVSVDVTIKGTSGCASVGRTESWFPADGGSLAICTNGTWKTSGPDAVPSAQGHAVAASTYSLMLTVQDGSETFAINGTQVDTVTLTSEMVATGTINLQSSGAQASATFKNFRITPQP